MIRVEGLRAGVGGFSLGPVDLSVPPATSFVLLGPTGAGKTVFLETILGLNPPSSGRIFMGGRDITDLPPERRAIAYLPQDVAIFPHLSVRENILFGPAVRRLPRRDWAAAFEILVDRLKLEGILGRKTVRGLSGGERQRVALARALVVKPSVLFLDEPFSALDGPVRRSLQLSIRDLQRETGLTFFLVTHDQEEAFVMADRMAVMLDGRIEQEGAPEDFHESPRNMAVARFLLMRNLFTGEAAGARGDRVVLLAAGVRLEAMRPREENVEGSWHIGIRPENIVLIRPDRPLALWMTSNLLEGVVERVLNLGNRRVLSVSVRGGDGLSLEVALSQHAYHDVRPAEGDAVRLHVKPENIWLHRE